MRIGTRKSAMALAQTEEIARRLRRRLPGIDVEIVKFETTGDNDQTSKLLPHGGKGGAFVSEIRAAVLAGELHAAMHSLKDMPGNEDTPGLVDRRDAGARSARRCAGAAARACRSTRSRPRAAKVSRSAPMRCAARPTARRLFAGSSRSSTTAAPPTPACASSTIRRAAAACRTAARAVRPTR